ncbi:6,7-dimethyl-8-ribityllumazine synthase [bacterium]|nr:6,7-dimethyl-8-ribityllumazine synthase [bacterium]MBU1598890.1 6,7-dimethyl-8-ribityllumazine synthase [bacterium]
MKVYEGKMDAKGMRFGIVVGRFNEFISKLLKDGCVDTLIRHNAETDNICLFYVPGAFEISQIAYKLAKEKTFDAVICLGAVIRGDTPHFEYIAQGVSKGIAKASLDTGTPVIFGVITADNIEQAIERAGTKSGNKGRDAALSAIEMVSLLKEMEEK